MGCNGLRFLAGKSANYADLVVWLFSRDKGLNFGGKSDFLWQF
jgi:hypothetical protein